MTNKRRVPNEAFGQAGASRSMLWVTLLVGSCATLGCGEASEDWPSRAELVELVEVAAQADSADIRAEVVRLAAQSQAPELQPLVAAAIDDAAPIVRASALEAHLQSTAGEIDETLYQRLLNEDASARRAVFDLIFRLGSPTLRAQMIERSLRHTSAPFRQYALRRVVLEQHEGVSVPPEAVERAIIDESPMVSAEILDLLVRRGDATALDPVHRSLQSDDESDRLRALHLLAVTPSLNSWPVVRWIRRNGSLVEQRLAALAMARLGDATVSDELREILRTGDEALIPLAVRALAGLPGLESQREVSRHASDTRPEIRRAVVRSLIALEAPPEQLVDFLDDPDPEVASLAIEHLLTTELDQLEGRVCSELRLAADPLPLLRFLWLSQQERGSRSLTQACAAQLEQLMAAPSPDVDGMAARLYFSSRAPDPGRAVRPGETPVPVIYAFLTSSLEWDPAEYRPIYRRLLGHELLIVRVAAAIGLLETTPT